MSQTLFQPTSLSNEEVLRYSRHLIMPEVGIEGQQKLKAARVRTIGLVDFDVVDFTNLQRQIIHFTSDVGRPKLESAKNKIAAVNPFVEVRTFETKLSSENALQIFADFDIIV